MRIFWRRWRSQSKRTRFLLKGILIFVCICLLGRSLPYLAPIRTSDFKLGNQAIEFSDRQGNPLGTILSRDQEHRVTVAIAQVSPLFIQAIIAAEDRNYYNHGALDLGAIARAAINSIQARQIVSGASTITMQLARMKERSPSNLVGKLQEIWTAWRMVAGMDKQEILQAYVNALPMGGNIYGVEAASRIYFGSSAKNLNLAQASMLAAIPNDPTFLNPYANLNALKERQKYVLNRLVKDGYTTSAKINHAFSEAIGLQPRQQGILAAPHFLFWLADQLPQNHGAKIRTTIDRPLQDFVQAQITQILANLNARHAAALVINHRSGEVMAYVGSPDYFADGEQGQNDGVQALRQPGSTLKPFLYQLGLEHRTILANSLLADTPSYYSMPGAMLYSPSDYSQTFQGVVRTRIALANSLNVPAVKILERLNVKNFLDRLHQLGFQHLDKSPEYYGLGLTLGSGEVSLWELARAYMAIANQGKLIYPIASFDLPVSSSIKVSDATASWQWITDVLSDRYARSLAFGVDSVLSLPFAAAVKTGTSSNFRDTWTVGFTSEYTVATWVGNFDGTPMPKVSGVTGAAPLWQRIMLHLHQEHEPQPFPKPQGMTQLPICSTTGKKPRQNCEAIAQEYFFPQDVADYENNGSLANLAERKSQSIELPSDKLASAKLVRESSNCQILSPNQGDVFNLDAAEKLEWKVKTSKSVQWYLNDRPINIQTTSQNLASFFWPMQVGKWRLQAQCGDRTAQIEFEVTPILPHQLRPGFSVVNKQ